MMNNNWLTHNGNGYNTGHHIETAIFVIGNGTDDNECELISNLPILIPNYRRSDLIFETRLFECTWLPFFSGRRSSIRFRFGLLVFWLPTKTAKCEILQ
ncbi:hypothetical protein F8M41_012482 [Gigaspora margarita]|uniref:Uncharacterized protein n=1 Tax=Gigaspora margarita TaxID=4874 RepID=A0A8H3ZZX3_GIGMA|nr:hypothetical protein F8M41_012482 [Gigaspora margarita]